MAEQSNLSNKRTAAMSDTKIARALPPIPPDPRPTKKQIKAFAKSVPNEWQREFAEFFCGAEQRLNSPDLFWHPFAPSGYDAYLARINGDRSAGG